MNCVVGKAFSDIFRVHGTDQLISYIIQKRYVYCYRKDTGCPVKRFTPLQLIW